MSNTNVKLGYGFIADTDSSLTTKTGGKFGLNPNAFVTKFELNTKAGASGADGDALDIEVLVGEKNFMSRLYPVGNIKDKNGNNITDTNSKEYIDGFNAAVTQLNGTIVHFLKAFGINEDFIKQKLSTPVQSFAEFITNVVSLVPADFKTKPVDVFLEYQWNITEGQDRTFLTLPKNMKGGYFICPAQPGTWTEEITEEGKLIYRNQNGMQHPFVKTKDFRESKKGVQQIVGQIVGQDNDAALAAAAGIKPGNGAAQTGKW